MPNGDRTGPLGEGPRIGCGFGFGKGSNFHGYQRIQQEELVGKGIGWGNRRRNKCWNTRTGTPNQLEQLEQLQREARHLETSLDQIKQRLVELEKQEHTE